MVTDSYHALREQMLLDERRAFPTPPATLPLTVEERKLDDLMLELKTEELAQFCQDNHGKHPAQVGIHNLKRWLPSHTGWKLITEMPKGGILHLHFDSMAFRWLIQEATYLPNCYFTRQRVDGHESIRFKFLSSPAAAELDYQRQQQEHLANGGEAVGSKWQSVAEARRLHGCPKEFDDELHRRMTLLPQIELGTHHFAEKHLWSQFVDTFAAAHGLITYTPVFKRYVEHKLATLLAENVMYVEERMVAFASLLYDVDGTVHPFEYTVQTYRSVVEEFCRQNPQFHGAKLIYCTLKSVSRLVFRQELEAACRLHKAYPDTIVGFDAVGYEDEGYSLEEFAEEIWPLRHSIPFVWHAGETLMVGTKADQNLYDAILMGTRRIGHGLSLTHHPHLQELVRQNSIAIELCPLSNRVLKYVPSDLRLHPIGAFLANGLPVVLAPDDPAIFGLESEPCSHDFWVTWMLWERVVNVANLKQFALNSIKVSIDGHRQYLAYKIRV